MCLVFSNIARLDCSAFWEDEPHISVIDDGNWAAVVDFASPRSMEWASLGSHF